MNREYYVPRKVRRLVPLKTVEGGHDAKWPRRCASSLGCRVKQPVGSSQGRHALATQQERWSHAPHSVETTSTEHHRMMGASSGRPRPGETTLLGFTPRFCLHRGKRCVEGANLVETTRSQTYRPHGSIGPPLPYSQEHFQPLQRLLAHDLRPCDTKPSLQQNTRRCRKAPRRRNGKRYIGIAPELEVSRPRLRSEDNICPGISAGCSSSKTSSGREFERPGLSVGDGTRGSLTSGWDRRPQGEPLRSVRGVISMKDIPDQLQHTERPPSAPSRPLLWLPGRYPV